MVRSVGATKQRAIARHAQQQRDAQRREAVGAGGRILPGSRAVLVRADAMCAISLLQQIFAEKPGHRQKYSVERGQQRRSKPATAPADRRTGPRWLRRWRSAPASAAAAAAAASSSSRIRACEEMAEKTVPTMARRQRAENQHDHEPAEHRQQCCKL